jgi:hypothetical protein
MDNNISPEEILRRKEIEGGLVYDDPVRKNIEPVNEPMVNQPNPITPPETKFEQPVIREVREVNEIREQEKPVASLGKSQASNRPLSFEMGWKNIPVDILPSRGDYYPDGTKIAIRAAEVREIRHFSTIDEDDKLDIEEKLTHIIDRCSRMEFPGEGVVSYKDLKQEDRFFIIMAIRDLTFVKGENSIILKTQKTCNQTMECPFNDGIELRTGVLSSYELDEQVAKYYNPETRSFVFNIKKIEKIIELFIPSIGVTQAITSFVSECNRKKVEIDEGFLSIAPFLFNDWRDLNYERILMKMRESDYWTKEEFSLYFELSERIKMGTMLDVKQKCPVCGDEEVTAKITFPNGIRSLFLISDIFRELL